MQGIAFGLAMDYQIFLVVFAAVLIMPSVFADDSPDPGEHDRERSY